MIGQTLGHYRILEQIGAGGMGVVYRAHDERLDRDVALKVLPTGTLADEAARKRFRKEALTLSKLNHPNIETVFDFDSQDSVDFLVMELIPGISLDQKLLAGALPEKEVLRLGQQLAEGLAAAHAESIIHRDLKPGNLRVTPDGRLKILDFGLAKLFREVAETDVTASVTMTQGVTGTLPYMAPEQLRGEKVDARSDIWAAGAVLYELATGRRPFPDEQGPLLIDAILNKEPKRPCALNGGLSAHLESLILKALDKEPKRRYQSALELRVDLERLVSGAALTVSTRLQALRRRRGLSVAALLLMAAIGVGVNLGGVRDRLLNTAAVPRIESLAVLPLENLSGDPEQAYLAEGMHEALITDLGKLNGLRRVTARSSVMRYRKTDKPLPQIAKELGVDAVITGSVLRSGDRVQITAHLIRAATEERLWSDRYERELRDVLSMENEIVVAITRQIKLQLTPEEKVRLASARPVNPEAYEAYLKGRFHFYKLSREELNTAERYFQLASEKDPQYALAYVGMADVWGARGDAGFLPVRETAPKMRTALLRALELDDTLAEAHVTRANLVWISESAWPLAEKDFRHAIQVNPSYADAHFYYSDLLISLKRNDEWNVEVRRALELDPLNFFYQCFYGWHLVYLRRYDEAIAQFRKVLSTQPDFSSAHMGLWGAYYKKGMDAEALAEAKKFFTVLGDREAVEALDRGYAQAGYRGAMKRAGDKLAARAQRTHVPAIRIARVYAHAGAKDLALAWLEKAYERHEFTTLAHLGVGWDWDDLRSDSRFQDLLRRLNLPP